MNWNLPVIFEPWNISSKLYILKLLIVNMPYIINFLTRIWTNKKIVIIFFQVTVGGWKIMKSSHKWSKNNPWQFFEYLYPVKLETWNNKTKSARSAQLLGPIKQVWCCSLQLICSIEVTIGRIISLTFDRYKHKTCGFKFPRVHQSVCIDLHA